MQPLAQAHYLECRDALAGLLGRLVELLSLAGRADLSQTANELLDHVAEPFLIVVVGEVKTGKSSLLNALLGTAVSAVAPDPCTDRIRIITRGAEPGETPDGPLCTRVSLDHPMLEGIALVDTPGVDSIIDRHQEITEGFIPRADLVLFVFSILNPYSRAAWTFFDLVAETWRRKVVFVLTQADLATPEQITVNTARLRELATQHGLTDPPVFLVSALEAEPGEGDAGGMEALRDHIRTMTSRGGHYADKLDATRRSALRLLTVLRQSLDSTEQELAVDVAEADRLRSRLVSARRLADREVEVLRARVETAYARLAGDFETAFAAELTVSAMMGRALRFWKRKGGKTGPVDRLQALGETFGRDLEREVEDIARQGAGQVFEDITGQVRALLESLRPERRETSDAGLDTLARQRDRVLTEVTARVEALLAEGGPTAGLDTRPVSGLDPRTAMGGTLVVLGTVFAMAVKGAVLDVTGGVVAAAGALLAGSALYWQRPRVMRELRRRLAAGGDRLRLELGERLGSRLDRIFRELDDRFAPFFEDIDARRAALSRLTERHAALTEALEAFDVEACGTPDRG